jgi:RimJ/RimL family protein N-acetyltransferase
VIETERLLLRKPTTADVEDPPAFLSDPRVMDFLGGVGDTPGAVVQLWLDGWDTFPAGKLIVQTAAGERIGRSASTSTTRTAGSGRARRALNPSSPGRSRMSSGAALAAREWLQAPRVISLIVPDNVASQRVAQRLGATPGEAVELPGYGPHVIWTHPR